MATTVTITGSGTPVLVPGRAGPGVHVRSGEVSLQFDAGRATSLRLIEADEHPGDLAALFVTHHHSDHLVGLPALLTDRWLEGPADAEPAPLPVVAPAGPAADLVAAMMGAWIGEATMRSAHTGRRGQPLPDVRPFPATPDPLSVFTSGLVEVSAVAVRHEPVVPAVAYRVDGPDGAVVVSGDTAVCDEVAGLATGAALLVHEAYRTEAAATLVSDPDAIAAYHADTERLGALAARIDVPRILLTHLIPPPAGPADEQAFVADVRRGGYGGEVVVARDLTSVRL